MKHLYLSLSALALTATPALADTAEATTLPYGVEPQQWVLYHEYEARMVSVAIDGSQIYLGDLTDYLPAAYVVGTIDGDRVSFPLTDMGYVDELDENLFFVPLTFDTRFLPDYNQEWEDYYVVADYLFAYDAEARELTCVDDYSAFLIGSACRVGDLGPAWVEYYHEPSIKWIDPMAANAPLDNPEFLSAYFDEFYENDCVEFFLPIVNQGGYPLDTDRMYYVFYVDGEPYTFTPTNYIGLDEDMTEVPFDFTDEFNFDIFANGSYHAIALYLDEYTTVGLKLYYRADDDTVLESDYIEADIAELSDGALGSVAVTVTETDAPIHFYDLNGRVVRTATLTPGIYIRRQGATATKVVVK